MGIFFTQTKIAYVKKLTKVNHPKQNRTSLKPYDIRNYMNPFKIRLKKKKWNISQFKNVI